jgi:hypothetical protein
LAGGPLSEQPGTAWVSVAEDAVPELPETLHRLGYSESVQLVRPAESLVGTAGTTNARWKGRNIALVPLYSEPDSVVRQFDPDRRSFLLECGDGVVRRITGYRGGRGALEHRALPVIDARLLVNLVASSSLGRLLDPFAGAGGIAIEARAAGWTVLSVDKDPTLRHGLAELADEHVVGDATNLPHRDASVDAVATEPPYHTSALATVVASIGEIGRVLKAGGRAAMLVGSDQAEPVRRAARQVGLTPELDIAIDRKGTDVTCLSWVRRT